MGESLDRLTAVSDPGMVSLSAIERVRSYFANRGGQRVHVEGYTRKSPSSLTNHELVEALHDTDVDENYHQALVNEFRARESGQSPSRPDTERIKKMAQAWRNETLDKLGVPVGHRASTSPRIYPMPGRGSHGGYSKSTVREAADAIRSLAYENGGVLFSPRDDDPPWADSRGLTQERLQRLLR